MKFLLACFVFIFFHTTAKCQDYKKVSNIPECKKTIMAHHLSMKSIVANFSESFYSKMFIAPQKGSGALYYKQSQYVRWENIEPQKKVILINGNSIRISENGKEVAGANAKVIGKKIQNMIMQMLTGEFLDEKDFDISYFESPKQYKLLLTPKKKQLAKYISRVDLLFDKKSLLLNEMTMIEDENDKVVYTFTNYQLNGPISDSKFSTF